MKSCAAGRALGYHSVTSVTCWNILWPRHRVSEVILPSSSRAHLGLPVALAPILVDKMLAAHDMSLVLPHT